MKKLLFSTLLVLALPSAALAEVVVGVTVSSTALRQPLVFNHKMLLIYGPKPSVASLRATLCLTMRLM